MGEIYPLTNSQEVHDFLAQYDPHIEIRGNRMDREEFLADSVAVREYLLTDPSSLSPEEAEFYCFVAEFHNKKKGFCDRASALNRASQIHKPKPKKGRKKIHNFISASEYAKCRARLDKRKDSGDRVEICFADLDEARETEMAEPIKDAISDLVATADRFDEKTEIIVKQRDDVPMVLYNRGLNREYFVYLSNNAFKSMGELAYQFAHEFCHILSRYDSDHHGHSWFEETLCELTSISVLFHTSNRWNLSDSPYRHLQQSFISYGVWNGNRYGRMPQIDTRSWYDQHADQLHGTHNHTLEKRRLYGILARMLLYNDLEGKFEGWGAIQYINDGKPEGPLSFSEFLYDWHRNSPGKHKPFIEKIAEKLGVELNKKN